MNGFERPAAFLFALAPLIFYALRRFLWRRKLGSGGGCAGDPRFMAFGFNASSAEETVRPPRPGRGRAFLHRLAAIAFWAAWVLLTITAAGPLQVRKGLVFLERGKDIVFILDVSPSMAAGDMEIPDGRGRMRTVSRFEACADIIRQFATSGGNSSLGLVSFGTEAVLSVPPTEDRASFLSGLAALEPGVRGDGTALGMGILTALYHLRDSRAPSRLAILFTDGENNAGEVGPERAADLCREAGLELDIVAVGRKGQTSLSWTDPETGRSYQGSYLSDFDPSALGSLAARAGGTFALAGDAEALGRVRADILRVSGPAGRFRETDESRSAAKPFLIAGLALLLLSWFLSSPLLEASEWP